jgi:signal transduction histidine kinase/FixJ family two-component response regulator
MTEQQVFRAQRNYNRWVANQTLEDYALRFTAKSARRWSISRVSNTALGAISFLALEAIGGVITIHYGFDNAIFAIIAVSTVIFLTGLPICYYAARYGVDIDLLSRGAGFGYIGSTITSLIYASFTFIFFAIEAAIMSSALELLFDLPLSIGYLISSLVVIPLATHGITFISRFQLWSQPVWIVLQLTPIVFILFHEWSSVDNWMQHQGVAPTQGTGLNLIFFGAASGVLFSLISQIGEQVDFLRFMPEPTARNRTNWWLALVAAGPGWIIVGMIKILAGSFLAVLAISYGVPSNLAVDPTQMYLTAFSFITQSPTAALALAGIFVIVCQLKINVTNAYGGSIAWSNFFSRLTHSHPGRVVWLVFNVVIALLLMELGVYEALENILGIYSNVAVAWVGALVADLVINKPLGYSPKHIEFKRAHLYDINPVGFGAMLIASASGIIAETGIFGETTQALSPYIALLAAFVVSPLIAIATKGRYYIARKSHFDASGSHTATCEFCQNEFEVDDMTTCPAYGIAICSLCCSIDAQCQDQCKEGARISDQLSALMAAILPRKLAASMDNRLLHFCGLLTLIAAIIATTFWLVYQRFYFDNPEISSAVASTLTNVYILLMIIVGVLVWLYVLANESRQFALKESQRQTLLLKSEILAHNKTDLALQKAKEEAEAANLAKSRYLTGISHELRSPLNSILGYAQLLEKDSSLSLSQLKKAHLIRRNGDYLTDLIEGLLDISRIEAGRLEISRDKVSLSNLLSELTEMFELQAQSKGLEFHYHLLSPLPNVVATDEKHLRQILINLLSNAIKYTECGSVTFEVKYRSQVAEFTVRDTGVGIEQEKYDQIFLPFERIRQPGSPQSPGTGLGLTISKFLTEIMGGEISVQSSPGEGSTFKLSLMLSSISEPVTQTTPARKITSYHGERKTIMVVDDDASHRGLLSEILTPLNFTVLEAADANACLKSIEHAHIDLFLLDISMPGMNGWELLRTLRKQYPKTPIIMVSADATESPQYYDELNTTRQLNDDYLVKPIRDSVLLDKIARVLDLQWQDERNTDLPVQVKAKDTIEWQSDIFSGDKQSDFKKLISYAELGYVEGLKDVFSRLEQQGDSELLVSSMREHLNQFQFAKIISVAKKALS